MPLYEYECQACGHRFERLQKFSDPPLEQCPKCGGAVHKLQSAPAFQFKGSGWYITDYARKEAGSSGGESKSSASDGETKADAKTDAKTDNSKPDPTPAPSDAKTTKANP